MEGPTRPEPLRAIFDPDRPERVALLGTRRFGEPVPVEAILRHPCRAPRPAAELVECGPLRILDRPRVGKFEPLT